jgi:hypothetical protein
MGSHIPSLEFLAVLLGDAPAIPNYTCFYQRLLAHDEREASDLLFKCLNTEPLVTVYDTILIPALTLVEKDRQQGDLDDSTLLFIRNTTSELVEELGFRALEEQSQATTTSPEQAAEAASAPPRPLDTSSAAPSSARPLAPSSPLESDLKVAVLPIRDGADALVATMLTQVLTLAGINAVSLPVRAIHETVESVAKQNPAVVFLSGMPPVAMARANRLYRGLRSATQQAGTAEAARRDAASRAAAPGREALLPDLKIVVGIWNYTEDPARAAQMITRSEAFHISTSLADALAQATSLTSAKPAVPQPLDNSPQLVAAPKDTAA